MAAFELLYERYRAPLYRYLLRLAGPGAADDCYQGSWEKIIKARARYRSGIPFKPWLFRIARNHFIDTVRAAKPAESLTVEPEDEQTPGPGEAHAAQQRTQALQQALSALPPEQRDAITLKLEGGFDLDTIAAITGVGRETAKSRIRYASNSLKKALQS